MELGTLKLKLEEQAASRGQSSVTASRFDELKRQCRELLAQHGFTPGSDEWVDCDDYIGYLRIHSQHISRTWFGAILDIMAEIRERWSGLDPRKINFYPLDVVLAVILLAGPDNVTDTAGIAGCWRKNNPILQILMPGMPDPKWMISTATLHTVITLAPEKVVVGFFTKCFNEIKAMAETVAELGEGAGKRFRPTLGGDGQEMRSSYKKGEHDRKGKGANCVSLFECDSKTVISFTSRDKKNQEADAFIEMLKNMGAIDNCVLYADAINTRPKLSDYLDSVNCDWILPVKRNNGNMKLNFAIESKFVSLRDKGWIKHSCPFKENRHGREEESGFSAIPASEIDPELLEKFPSTKSIIRYEKAVRRVLSSNPDGAADGPTRRVSYLISSLPCDKEGFEQAVHSIRVRWACEARHNTLDVVMMQDSVEAWNRNYLSFTAGFNKIACNVANWARHRMPYEGWGRSRPAKPGSNPKPVSFKAAFEVMSNPEKAMRYLLEYLLEGNRLDEAKPEGSEG